MRYLEIVRGSLVALVAQRMTTHAVVGVQSHTTLQRRFVGQVGFERQHLPVASRRGHPHSRNPQQ